MSTTSETLTADEQRLAELGYKQELNRRWSGFSNFAISFAIICILAGGFTTYGQALKNGGPIAISIAWPLISVLILCVAWSMSELASAFPTAGGIYYWSSKLGGAAWGWFTGWFNLIGQIAITAGIDYGAAVFTDALLQLLFPSSFHGTQHEIVAVYAVILFLHAVMNIFSVKLVALLNDISV
ncbi:MAG TPA: amino acid permease, partial [Solirubrobacteraceae bacterium]|nr:amino acid permease [Solirubrobacteraceae bacterium]